MDDLQIYILLNSISVISRHWAGVNEKLCAMEPHLQLKRALPMVGLEPRTVDQ